MAADPADKVFEVAAELFALLSTPTRLRIVCILCDGEMKVSDIRQRVGVSQSNLSQHLGVLYRSGVLGRRRAGTQVYYRVISQRVLLLRDGVCDDKGASPATAGPARGSRESRSKEQP